MSAEKEQRFQEIVKNHFVNPIDQGVGRRTGWVLNKEVRKDDEGFEVFDDYWSESGDETTDDLSLHVNNISRKKKLSLKSAAKESVTAESAVEQEVESGQANTTLTQTRRDPEGTSVPQPAAEQPRPATPTDESTEVEGVTTETPPPPPPTTTVVQESDVTGSIIKGGTSFDVPNSALQEFKTRTRLSFGGDLGNGPTRRRSARNQRSAKGADEAGGSSKGTGNLQASLKPVGLGRAVNRPAEDVTDVTDVTDKTEQRSRKSVSFAPEKRPDEDEEMPSESEENAEPVETATASAQEGSSTDGKTAPVTTKKQTVSTTAAAKRKSRGTTRKVSVGDESVKVMIQDASTSAPIVVKRVSVAMERVSLAVSRTVPDNVSPSEGDEAAKETTAAKETNANEEWFDGEAPPPDISRPRIEDSEMEVTYQILNEKNRTKPAAKKPSSKSQEGIDVDEDTFISLKRSIAVQDDTARDIASLETADNILQIEVDSIADDDDEEEDVEIVENDRSFTQSTAAATTTTGRNPREKAGRKAAGRSDAKRARRPKNQARSTSADRDHLSQLVDAGKQENRDGKVAGNSKSVRRRRLEEESIPDRDAQFVMGETEGETGGHSELPTRQARSSSTDSSSGAVPDKPAAPIQSGKQRRGKSLKKAKAKAKRTETKAPAASTKKPTGRRSAVLRESCKDSESDSAGTGRLGLRRGLKRGSDSDSCQEERLADAEEMNPSLPSTSTQLEHHPSPKKQVLSAQAATRTRTRRGQKRGSDSVSSSQEEERLVEEIDTSLIPSTSTQPEYRPSAKKQLTSAFPTQKSPRSKKRISVHFGDDVIPGFVSESSAESGPTLVTNLDASRDGPPRTKTRPSTPGLPLRKQSGVSAVANVTIVNERPPQAQNTPRASTAPRRGRKRGKRKLYSGDLPSNTLLEQTQAVADAPRSSMGPNASIAAGAVAGLTGVSGRRRKEVRGRRGKGVAATKKLQARRETLGDVQGSDDVAVDFVGNYENGDSSIESSSSGVPLGPGKEPPAVPAMPSSPTASPIASPRGSTDNTVDTELVPRSILKTSTSNRAGRVRRKQDLTLQFVEAPRRKAIIIPPDEPTDGDPRRRTKRNRIIPVRYWLNERAVYERRKSGGFVLSGVQSPICSSSDEYTAKKKRTASAKSRVPLTPANLSMHVSPPPGSRAVDDPTMVVVNPDTQEEVEIDALKTSKMYKFVGPSGKKAQADDPITLCKCISQKAFSSGILTIRALCEKGMQLVRHDTMVFYVTRGKVAVTVHHTTSIMQNGDMFFVPQGNMYNIRNLRRDEAKLVFFQHKGQ